MAFLLENAERCDMCGTASWEWEEVCEPEYYVWQYSEPDWCLYTPGDRVDILRHPQTFVIYAWYVEPASDSNASGTYYVVHNSGGCTILVFP